MSIINADFCMEVDMMPIHHKLVEKYHFTNLFREAKALQPYIFNRFLLFMLMLAFLSERLLCIIFLEYNAFN